MRRLSVTFLGATIGVIAAIALAGFAGTGDAHAQALSPELDARALSIERQLLCPQCTNKRLDVCVLAICIDMRGQIRQQLADGRENDEIIFFFSNRYGQRVLADIPREGFNLVLFGWVGGSLIVVGLGGALFLLQLRRSGRAYRATQATTTAPVESPEDEAWLDRELPTDQR
jgi:cytochrome c-type biogenesis protein CcmH